MLAPETYTTHVAHTVEAIAAAAEGNLAAPVEHCGDFDVAALLVHTGGFCRFVGGLVRTGEPWEGSGAWRTPPATDVGGDPVGWHRRCGAELVDALAHGDPEQPASTWAGDRTLGFWYRRAAQELAVHRWDAEHARGVDLAIDPELAVDGIDELLVEFGPRVVGRYGGSGETYAFVPTDVDAPIHITMHPDRIEVDRERGPAEVTAAGTASDLLLFLWGRAPAAALTVTDGDARLLDRWHEGVRI